MSNMYVWYAIAYLIGSIPFGLILTLAFGYGDIRKIGSGNIGATNVLRTGNKFLAGLTLFLDMAKGVFLIFLWQYAMATKDMTEVIMPFNIAVIGFFGVLGHCFPVWLKFKGGKGVATAIGVLIAGLPASGLAAIVVWLLGFFVFRISSLAAILAMIAAPIVTLYMYGAPAAGVNAAMAAMVIFRHHANISRLLKGAEPKIGRK